MWTYSCSKTFHISIVTFARKYSDRTKLSVHLLVAYSVMIRNYVAAKATYIRLLYGKIGFFGIFFRP